MPISMTRCGALGQPVSWCLSADGLHEARRIDGLDKRLGILMWMVGLNIGCTIGLYALLFRALP